MIPSLGGSAIADIVSAFSLAASNTAGAAISAAIDRLMKSRQERARQILLEEIGSGARAPNDPGDIDEFVAIIYRYLTKACEGAARINLRLMARVMKGQLEDGGLYASEFLRYSELLASLTREEVILLATRYRCAKSFRAAHPRTDWSDTSMINKEVATALVPSVFPDAQHIQYALTALQRTGLVWPAAATAGGGFVWQDTPLLEKIASLARLEDIVAHPDLQSE